ncbi:Transcription initiation factor TFIID subunit 13 [Blomia tropicalis]|nr:Transcription initiation factor TFIID subunit 13 [Blomia tropicalis]
MSSNIESMDQESSNSVQDESTNAHEQVQIAVTTSTTTSTSNTPSTSSSGSSSISSTTTTNTIDRKKRLFSKELRCMMYGFGDDQNPYTETVDMLEDLVIHFIGDIALRALEVGRSGRVTVEDVMYLVRRDSRKYARVRDLLSMNEELKKARKAFDEVKYVQSV